MAFIVTNPVSVGDETLKSHYDGLYDNTQFLHTNILQVNGAAGVSIGDVTYALVGTSGFRLETAADPMIFEANGGYATNGGLIVYGSSHASAGRVYAATGTAAANGELLAYDNKNTANIFSATYAKTSVRPVLNLFATDALDIIPGTGVDASAQTSTGGLRLSGGAAYYYAGTGAGSGFRVYTAHASAPVLRMVLNTQSDEFGIYNNSGQLTFYTSTAAGAETTSFYDGGTQVLYIDHSSSTQSNIVSAQDMLFTIGSYDVVRFYNSYTNFDQTNMQHIRFPTVSGAPSTGVANGSVYYDTATSKLRAYAGGAWVDLH